MLSTSGGLGEAETAGVTLNAIPREGGNTFSGTFFANGANGAHAGQQLHPGAEGPGAQGAVRVESSTSSIRWAAAGSSATSCGSTLVSPDRDRQLGARHVGEQERRQPERLDGGFRRSQQAFSETLDRILSARVTWQATPRNKINVSWQEQIYHRN